MFQIARLPPPLCGHRAVNDLLGEYGQCSEFLESRRRYCTINFNRDRKSLRSASSTSPRGAALNAGRGGGYRPGCRAGRVSGATTGTLSGSAILEDVVPVPRARHLLRAKALMDCRYFEPLGVPVLARTAGLSPAHFSREFRRTFGETPHHYLLTRRLERAAALLRNTDRKVADICVSVGLTVWARSRRPSSRYFGCSPTTYRAKFPPAAEQARMPACVAKACGRPLQNSSFREDNTKQAV